MDRPSTSKPRGICKYYNSPRGCFQGDRCKFLHGEQEKLTPYDKSKTCRHFVKGYCKRGADCWFRHVMPDVNTPGAAHAPPPMAADANICGICLEEPTTFGLLSGCSHIFCVECLRNWRDPEGKNEEMLFSHVNKKCPYCRTPSKSVTPSSHFYPDGHPGKAATIERHKASAHRVHCKYFQQSRPNDRFCPFGRDCIYLHENEDGTPYIFHAGVIIIWQLARRTQSSRESTERLFIENTVNRFLSSSFQDMNLYIEDIRTILSQSDSQNRSTTVQNRRNNANPTTGNNPGQSSGADGMETLAVNIIRDMTHLSNDIEDILTNSLRPTIMTLISEAEERSTAATDNTPTDVPHVPSIPLRPFDLGFNPSPRPASPTPSTDSLPGLESVSGSESESEYSGAIDDEDSSGDVPERQSNRSAELNILIARLRRAVSGVARAQGDVRSVEPEEPNHESSEAPEPPSPRSESPPLTLDDQQDDDVSTPEVVHPEEPDDPLLDAASASAGGDYSSETVDVGEHIYVSLPPSVISLGEAADLTSTVEALDSASTETPSAPSVAPLTQDMEAPQRPTSDAEPPFMTDGRGRVVWSRVGSKTGGTHGRGRGRPGDTEDTGSG